jgi:signal transduction histidine kinase
MAMQARDTTRMTPRILHLEDSDEDALLVRRELTAENLAENLTWVKSGADFQREMEGGKFDLILADAKIPLFSGIEALEISRRLSPGTPFIFVSGTMGEETAVNCLKRGATDYILKDHLPRLRPAVWRALSEHRERQVRREELESLNAQMLAAARLSGMEEVATNVLHNVGNVLNSLNVSALTAVERVTNSRLNGLGRVAAMVGSHSENLAAFITTDPRGQQLPGYLETLAKYWNEEQAVLLRELLRLTKHIDHIKDIVNRQQSFTTASGHAEAASVSALLDDALAITVGAEESRLIVRRECDVDFSIQVDRRRFILILVNLLNNARDSLLGCEVKNKRITIRAELLEEGLARVEVIDNGAGITPEDLGRICSRGFTTKKGGHGFGLHGSALAAREMGGSLTVQSDGPGKGARFTVKIPLAPAAPKEAAVSP